MLLQGLCHGVSLESEEVLSLEEEGVTDVVCLKAAIVAGVLDRRIHIFWQRRDDNKWHWGSRESGVLSRFGWY